MNNANSYKKVVKGHSLGGYCQWKSLKENELGSLEKGTLENMQKYYEYNKRSIENGTIFDGFQASFFSVIGVIITLIITLIISFGSNLVNSFSDFAIDIENKELKMEMIEFCQKSNIELLNIILNFILYFAGALLILVLCFFIIKNYYKKSAIVKKMYCEEMIELIEKVIENK